MRFAVADPENIWIAGCITFAVGTILSTCAIANIDDFVFWGIAPFDNAAAGKFRYGYDLKGPMACRF